MNTAAKNRIQVITRAANVLRSLEGESDGLTLAQISQRVGLARSTVQRIVDALREEQFLIAASPTSGVRLGPALIRLAASASVHFDYVTRPIMMELSQDIGETVDLSVLKNVPLYKERVHAQLRVEMFNVLKRTNLAQPLNSLGDGSAFGWSTSTIGVSYGAPGIGSGEPYNTQLALKIIF